MRKISETEIERKYLISEELEEYIDLNIVEREGIAQWYIQNKRIRVVLHEDKTEWIVQTKKTLKEPESREERTINEDVNKKTLHKYPVVIKWRYYVDKEKSISIDHYIFPKIKGKILEIELNEIEKEEYERIDSNEKYAEDEKSLKKDKIFSSKIKPFKIPYNELLKNEKTLDKSYYNFSISKILDGKLNLPRAQSKIERKFYALLKNVYEKL